MFDPKNPGGAYGEISQRGVVEIVLDNGKIVPFLYMGTAYGDGVFDFTSGNAPRIGTDIGVDAGLICAIRVEDLVHFNPIFQAAENGRIIPDFEGEVIITDRGVMEGSGKAIGFKINTDEVEEDEDDSWIDDSEDEEGY
jgi:hypothetical protein